MKYRAALLFITSLLLSSTVTAHTAWKEMAAQSAAPYYWTGWYAGINLGAVQNTMDVTDNQATTFNATLRQVSNPGVTGGFQAGYRRQLNLDGSSGVYGVEFSANFADNDFSKQYGSPFALYQINASKQLKNVCLLQLTGGIAADRTLLFLAAGLSWSDITGSLTNNDSIAVFNNVNLNKYQFGTAVGGGVEYAWNDKFSVRFKVDLITPNAYTAHDDYGDSFLVANSIMQGTFGINYQFD